ncbi:MAG: penicillin-binding protein 2 [Melioribacteraceae bacterium]|nr:penicillin-binding protein 2 [Melioribacteraceae bacterium]
MTDEYFGSYIRKDIILYSLIVLFGLFTFRLFKMQILDNPIYKEKSEENSIKAVTVDAPRGVLYDRNFKYLVSNKPSYSLELIPENFSFANIGFIEYGISLDSGFVSNALANQKNIPAHIPRKIIENLSTPSIAWIEENKRNIPGIYLTVDLQRDYSFGIRGSHIFGYIKEIDSRRFKEMKDEYDLGDFIGYSGIEKTYEKYLRGEKGFEFFVVDAQQHKKGRYENGTNDIKPVKGNDLVLTIDKEVQKKAEELFRDKSGALVAIEPSTGEVLALVSAPDYDLGQLSSVTSNKVWNELSTDGNKPLFNRATMSSNPPGSPFKIITAIAALEEGIIDPSFTYVCQGGYQFGDRFFKCTHVHGKMNLIQAIEHSCNTYFYQLILKIGLEKWVKVAKEFGFGEKTKIDISEESNGLLPDADYFDRTYGKGKWTSGYLISLAIGQGDIISTPLQLAKYTCLLANMGRSYQPHIVKGYIDHENSYVPLSFPEIKADISENTLKVVREGMRRVVNGEGTATNIKMKEFEISGKTGTAQNPHGEDHAIFIAFAPYDNPKIAVSVIVENVGFGSTHAAPVAKEIIKTYLLKNVPDENLASLK